MDGGRWLAGVVVIVCLLFLVRLALGARRRARWDAFWLRVYHRSHAGFRGLPGAFKRLWRRREASREAAEQTQALIDRVRRPPEAERRGNVIRPKAFSQPSSRKHPPTERP